MCPPLNIANETLRGGSVSVPFLGVPGLVDSACQPSQPTSGSAIKTNAGMLQSSLGREIQSKLSIIPGGNLRIIREATRFCIFGGVAQFL